MWLRWIFFEVLKIKTKLFESWALMVFTILTVFFWRKSETEFIKSHTNCDNPLNNFLQEACSGLPIAACDFKVVIKNSFQNRPWLYSYTGEYQPMRSKESQNRNFNRLPEPSLKLVSFFIEASRNYRYPAIIRPENTPPPLFCGNPKINRYCRPNKIHWCYKCKKANCHWRSLEKCRSGFIKQPVKMYRIVIRIIYLHPYPMYEYFKQNITVYCNICSPGLSNQFLSLTFTIPPSLYKIIQDITRFLKNWTHYLDEVESRAGILEQSMGTRNRVGTAL